MSAAAPAGVTPADNFLTAINANRDVQGFSPYESFVSAGIASKDTLLNADNLIALNFRLASQLTGSNLKMIAYMPSGFRGQANCGSKFGAYTANEFTSRISTALAGGGYAALPEGTTCTATTASNDPQPRVELSFAADSTLESGTNYAFMF